MIFNTHIYKEDNKVKIRFNSIISEDESPSVGYNYRSEAKANQDLVFE